jgi:MFS family permease
MDTLGAVLGPSLALLYLYFYPENYTTLFYIAFIPGLFAIAATLLLKEKKERFQEKRERLPSSRFWTIGK